MAKSLPNDFLPIWIQLSTMEACAINLFYCTQSQEKITCLQATPMNKSVFYFLPFAAG